MCICSFLGQVVFGALMLVALALTLTSMFTPGWSQLKATDVKEVNNINLGIFFCRNPGDSTTATQFSTNVSLSKLSRSNESLSTESSTNVSDYCKHWWDNLSGSIKAVIACMCLAVIVEVFSLVWTIFTIWACCCKSCLVPLLPILASVCAVLLAIAVGIYGVNYKQNFDPILQGKGLDSSVEISYSFYLACGAIVVCVADIVVGILTATLAKACL
ncbi:hypothetical protein L596_015110 [Steinernema carpocapsae]|uniref:Clc-like protein n=1 Tax=Steinernema carpocapsae TaxID=34508 RepID=A0A4V6A2Y6_STECR|nr:hypothetical protein L596_015110 [Steinernema carpocapsae]